MLDDILFRYESWCPFDTNALFLARIHDLEYKEVDLAGSNLSHNIQCLRGSNIPENSVIGMRNLAIAKQQVREGFVQVREYGYRPKVW